MWIQDFCTNCDKQCVSGSVYCSDTCRLNDERNRSCGSESPRPSRLSSPSPANSVDTLTDGVNPWAQRRLEASNTSSSSFSSTKYKQTQSFGSAPHPQCSGTPSELRLMYQSPMLHPANAMASSPPVSPLLTATAVEPVPMANLSSSAYSSWLRR